MSHEATARAIARDIATDLAMDIEGAGKYDDGTHAALIIRIAAALEANTEACERAIEAEKRDPDFIWYQGNVRYQRLNEVLDRILAAIRKGGT